MSPAPDLEHDGTEPSPPVPGRGSPREGGPSTNLAVIVIVAIAAGAIFWAGLSLGRGPAGRNDEERAAIQAFTEAYQHIADDFIGTPVPDQVLEGAIKGMFDVLDDPNSRYMNPSEFEAALDDASGEFEGIGAVMSTVDADGAACVTVGTDCQLVVVRVIDGAPAQEAGLQAGDVVTAVDGQSLEGKTIDDSVALIRGPQGSTVSLTIGRGHQEQALTITRDTVVASDVSAATLADGRVGYLAIDKFSTNAAADLVAALQKQLDAGVDRFIVDVRGDPGGFVDAAVTISSQFLSDGVVFWEEGADGQQQPMNVASGGIATDPAIQVVVLVDGGSASASEIFASALQDAGRARLIGRPSFGKGTVQEWSELPDDTGGFRLTVAKWLTRDKRWIDGQGLQPDVLVAQTGERYWADTTGDPAADTQLQAALGLLADEPGRGSSTTTGASLGSPTGDDPVAVAQATPSGS